MIKPTPIVRKAHAPALFCFFPHWGRLKSTSPVSAASSTQLETEAEPRTVSTHRWGLLAGASLGARWPHCQQARPGLIKDVEPNWSCQHLLPLHLGGWRRSSAQYAHRRSDLEERHDQTLHTKKVNGMNGDQRNLSASKDVSTMASVSDIKWTVHSLSINTTVVSLSVPHHCCRLFVSFASTRA